MAIDQFLVTHSLACPGAFGNYPEGVSDLLLRDLERAVATGDPGARLRLAAAYLRGGLAPAAIELLGWLSPEEAGDEIGQLERSAWFDALHALRPALKIPGSRLYHSLHGWIGDRYAAIGIHTVPPFVVFDRVERHLVPLAGLQEQTRVQGVSEAGLLCVRGGATVLHRLEDGALHPETLALAQGRPQALSDDGELLLSVRSTGYNTRGYLYRLPQGEELRVFPAQRFAFDWKRDLLLYTTPAPRRGIGIEPLRGDDPPRFVALNDLNAGTHFEIVGDGRLLVGQPPALFDPISPGPLRPVSSGPLHGPVRLSRDRQALLCVQSGQPQRVSLLGSGRPRSSVESKEPVHWHPRADVAVWGGYDRQAELLSFPAGAARGKLIVRLPVGLWPLGWTPDGLGLLLVRRLSGVEGLLELWTPGGAQ